MGMIKGIAVTLIDKVETGKDPFGNPIYEDKEIVVNNVLVSPTSSDDIVNQLTLTGKKAIYTLAIPKRILMIGKIKKLDSLVKRGGLLENHLKESRNLFH